MSDMEKNTVSASAVTSLTKLLNSKYDNVVLNGSVLTFYANGAKKKSIKLPIEEVENNSPSIWVGTQSEYDAISNKDSNTLYFIKEV